MDIAFVDTAFFRDVAPRRSDSVFEFVDVGGENDEFSREDVVYSGAIVGVEFCGFVGDVGRPASPGWRDKAASGSMAALDMSKGDKEQDRLDALKDVLGDFIKGNGKLKGRYDDAIGIVSFASYPDSDCPLTLDHVTLMQLVNDISIVTDREESGTAIGDALGL